jgi:TetR/AcrR family transcriptional regulator, lmrAB and yxaGH operons repressor
MKAGVPERMVESAIRLLAQRGFQATSFAALLEESKAPRGSIYYHFPGGKNQVIAAAIDLAGSRAVALVEALRGMSAVEIIAAFVGAWRSVLEVSDFGAGCSALAVTVSADEPELIDRVGEVFRSWRAKIADVFESSGLGPQQAAALGTTMLAACEGAVVLCRAERSFEPLDVVAGQLQLLAANRSAPARGRSRAR